jgi:hypothetical protein
MVLSESDDRHQNESEIKILIVEIVTKTIIHLFLFIGKILHQNYEIPLGNKIKSFEI